MNKKKIIRIILAIVIVAVVGTGIYFAVYYARFSAYKKALEEISFSEIDLAVVPDGVYRGEYDASLVRVIVDVTVEGQQMTKIDLVEHYNDRGEAAEKIVETILAEQSIQVDGVAGATNSSDVIKQAISNALESIE